MPVQRVDAYTTVHICCVRAAVDYIIMLWEPTEVQGEVQIVNTFVTRWAIVGHASRPWIHILRHTGDNRVQHHGYLTTLTAETVHTHDHFSVLNRGVGAYCTGSWHITAPLARVGDGRLPPSFARPQWLRPALGSPPREGINLPS